MTVLVILVKTVMSSAGALLRFTSYRHLQFLSHNNHDQKLTWPSVTNTYLSINSQCSFLLWCKVFCSPEGRLSSHFCIFFNSLHNLYIKDHFRKNVHFATTFQWQETARVRAMCRQFGCSSIARLQVRALQLPRQNDLAKDGLTLLEQWGRFAPLPGSHHRNGSCQPKEDGRHFQLHGLVLGKD